MDLLKFALFFAFSILFQGITQAQEWVSYQSEQQINDLIDTGDELLMATDAGLVVMNKTTLEKTIFNKSNSNLSTNHIQTITEGPNGTSWIGTYDVILMRFDGTDFQDATIPVADAIDQNTELYDFKVAPNGDFWLSTNDGVLHKQGQTWLHYDEDEFGPNFFEPWGIAINDDGEVFIGSFDLHKYSNGEWSILTDSVELEGYLHAELFFSSTGDLYHAGDLDRIGRFDGESWQVYEHGLNGSTIKHFSEDSEGNIYFQSLYNGIYKLENDTWTQQVNEQTNAFGNNTSYHYIDDQNNQWLNNGIFLSVNRNDEIESTLISDYTLESNGINNIHKGENGHMYFITSIGDNIAVVDPDGDWSFLPLPEPFSNIGQHDNLLVLADDDIWLSSGLGIHHYNGNEWTLNAIGSCDNFVMDSQGKIYAKGNDRVYIIDVDMVSEYNVDNSSISSLIISGIGVDESDNLWIASFNWDGEAMIQKVSTDGTWTNYSGTDFPVIDRPIGYFKFDNEGNVWVPSGLSGVCKFDGEEWTNPVRENMDEITNRDVHDIEIDGTGKLYFAHQYGVTTFFDNEWENLLIEEVPNEFTSANATLAFDNEGTLWWGSNRHGVFTLTQETTTSTQTTFVEETKFSIFPNPARNYTILDFETPISADVSVNIYNNLGQLKSSLDLGQLPAGNFQQRIDVSQFSSGLYVIQLQVNEKVSTKTIVIQQH